MITHLEEQWREERNVSTLFPEVSAIADGGPRAALKTIKRNAKVGENTLAETIDAAWWCLFGMLYSDEDDRINALPHDDYFYNENNFVKDAVMVCKCEMLRNEAGVHRYPVPKKGGSRQAKEKIKRFTNYREFVITSTISLVSEEAHPMMSGPPAHKMVIDALRCSQERILGYEPDDVDAVRKEQFVAIGNLIDDVFVHRGYCRKVEEEGAELLTPEQVDEWETSKSRIKQYASDECSPVPGFIRSMVSHPGFIGKPIA